MRQAATSAENSSHTYMNVRPDAARTLLFACVIPFLIATDAARPVRGSVRTLPHFRDPHFILTFEAGLEDYARRAAARAEAAHALLARAYGSTPAARSGWSSWIRGISSTDRRRRLPRTGSLRSRTRRSRVSLLHRRPDRIARHPRARPCFHLDEARGGWRVLRERSAAASYLPAPLRRQLPDRGAGDVLRIEAHRWRPRSRLAFPETLRAQLLETKGPQLDEAESDPGAWPLDRHYVFGSLFLDHLAGRYGGETAPAWMARRAGSFGSIVSRGAGVGELFGGRSLSQEWNDWIAAERDEALQLRDRLRANAPGLAETRRLCDVAHQTSFPRVSPDGSAVAFLATDEGRQPLGLYIADLQAASRGASPGWTARMRSRGRPMAARSSFRSSTLVDNARLFGDLFRVEIASGGSPGSPARRASRHRTSSVRPHARGRAVPEREAGW